MDLDVARIHGLVFDESISLQREKLSSVLENDILFSTLEDRINPRASQKLTDCRIGLPVL